MSCIQQLGTAVGEWGELGESNGMSATSTTSTTFSSNIIGVLISGMLSSGIIKGVKPETLLLGLVISYI